MEERVFFVVRWVPYIVNFHVKYNFKAFKPRLSLNNAFPSHLLLYRIFLFFMKKVLDILLKHVIMCTREGILETFFAIRWLIFYSADDR